MCCSDQLNPPPEAAIPARSVFGTIETCLPARQKSAYDFIDANPVRVIDVFVDALDLAEMRFAAI
jgi:hypothetical protein